MPIFNYTTCQFRKFTLPEVQMYDRKKVKFLHFTVLIVLSPSLGHTEYSVIIGSGHENLSSQCCQDILLKPQK